MFFFFLLWRCDPTRVMASSFLRFLDHTQQRTTVGRTPLDEWTSRRRDLYLTTHNTHNRQTSMSPLGFEPTISAGERPQTYALDRAVTGTGTLPCTRFVKLNLISKTHLCIGNLSDFVLPGFPDIMPKSLLIVPVQATCLVHCTFQDLVPYKLPVSCTAPSKTWSRTSYLSRALHLPRLGPVQATCLVHCSFQDLVPYKLPVSCTAPSKAWYP